MGINSIFFGYNQKEEEKECLFLVFMFYYQYCKVLVVQKKTAGME